MFQRDGFHGYSAEMLKTESNVAKPHQAIMFFLHCITQHGWPLGYLHTKNKSFLYTQPPEAEQYVQSLYYSVPVPF